MIECNGKKEIYENPFTRAYDAVEYKHYFLGSFFLSCLVPVQSLPSLHFVVWNTVSGGCHVQHVGCQEDPLHAGWMDLQAWVSENPVFHLSEHSLPCQDYTYDSLTEIDIAALDIVNIKY